MIYSFSNTIFDSLNENSSDLLDKIWSNSKDRHFLHEYNLDLLDVIWSNSKGRHFLLIDTIQNFDVIRNSQWYKHLRESNQKQIENQFIASAQLGKTQKRNGIIISHLEENTFSLTEASEILCKPFTIILENMEYDANFINTIIEKYKEGQEIKKHYNNGWLVYHNGGGSSIPNVINGMKDRFEKNKSQFPKKSNIYLRTFVIIDSDKTYPSTAEIAEDKTSLLAFIKDNTPCHVMLKREIENYLPDEIYDEIPDNEDFKTLYLTLDSTQKDFFDLEKGFPDKNFTQLDSNLQKLYNNVNDTAKKLFRKGGITFYKENGKKDNFKVRFSSLFLSKNITRENLERRAMSTNSNELQEILQKINDLL